MQVYNLFENDCDTLKIFDDYYMGGDSIQKCNKESILTNLVSQMIEILVQNRYPVLFPTKNANTIAVKNQISFLNKQSQGNQFNILTVFFRSIEHLIKKMWKNITILSLSIFTKWQILLEKNYQNNITQRKKNRGKQKVLSPTLTHLNHQNHDQLQFYRLSTWTWDCFQMYFFLLELFSL